MSIIVAGNAGITYLDYAASTPLNEKALEAMMPFLLQQANAGAQHHNFGAAAEKALQTARENAARAIGASAEEIVFTSGATEANNLVLKGLAATLKALGKTHIVTSAVEHKSILAPLSALGGFTVSVLPVKPCAMIEADMIEKALTAETGLVTIQAVNNETGTIQPLEEIADRLSGRGILFHTDAAQALGKIDFKAARARVDFASLSAHKVYGPQGIGALYVRSDRAALLEPLQHGGGQEQALRAGTVPVALCAGFGAACDLIRDDRARLQDLRNSFIKSLSALAPVIYGHSDPAWNAPGILNIRFPGIDSETLVMALPGLAFGLGAACSKYSHVIESIAGQQAAKESIRISFGEHITEQKLLNAANQIKAAVMEIRKMQEAV